MASLITVILAVTFIGSANAFLDLKIGVRDRGVRSICDKAEYKDLCLKSLTSRFNGKSDSTSLLVVLISSAEEATQRALDLVLQMKSQARDSFSQKRLKSCKSKYNDALGEMQGAVDAIKMKDYYTCQTQLSAAITYFSDCSDGFEGEIGDEEHPERDPLRKVNENLRNMVGNCLSIGNVVMKRIGS